MKTKIFRTSKRTLSVLLSVLMIVSTMIVGMVPVNATTDTVNAKSNTTMLVTAFTNSSDTYYSSTAVHMWNSDGSGDITSNYPAMTSAGYNGVRYYKPSESKINSNGYIKYAILKDAGSWNNAWQRDNDSAFKKDTQFVAWRTSNTGSGTFESFTPITIKSIDYPSSITNGDSASITVTADGGFPWFYYTKLNNTSDSKTYKLTVTDNAGNVIVNNKSFKYGADSKKCTFNWNASATNNKLTFKLSDSDGIDSVSYTKTFTVGAGVTLSKWHITGYQSGNSNITWDVNKLVVNGATGSATLTTNGNTNPIYFKLVAEKSDGSKYLCTTTKSYNDTLTKGVKSDPLDWCSLSNNNVDYATNSDNYDVELVYTPSSSAVSVTFKVSSDGNYNYVTVTETTSTVTTYTVTFGANDSDYGSVSAKTSSDTNVTSNSKVNKDTSVTFTATAKNSGVFGGWYYDEACTHAITGTDSTTLTYTQKITSNTVVYAKFSAPAGEEIGEPSGWYLHGDPAGGWGTGQKSKQLYKISSGLCYIDIEFTGSNNYFRFHNGSNDFGALNNQNNYSVYNNSTKVGITSQYTGAFKYSSEAGPVRIWLDPSSSKFWIEPGVVVVITPLAENVTVSAKFDDNGTTTGMVNETVTVTATIVNPASGVIVDSNDSNCNVTYTLYKNGTSTGISNKTGVFTNLTSGSSGQVSYSVKVTTTATYTDDSDNQQTYADVTSSTPAIVTYNAQGLYVADITKGTSNVTWTQISDSVSTYTINATVASGGSYTFVLSDRGAFNPDYTVSYDIDSSKCSYCTIEKGNILEGVTTYTVKCNSGCKNPVITIDKENRTIYAVASFTPTMTNTESSTEKVTYYFAEMTNNVNWVYNGAGVKIRYWNNSTGKNETKTVTTPAKVNGSNQIRVNTGELFNGPNAGYQTFNVYKTELPIWATSFVFIDSDGNDIYATSNSYNYYTYSSIALNPNRIYLFYATANGDDVRRYTKGVILDEQLWSSTNTTNYTNTKNFKANLVNYNDTLSTLNSKLSTAYSNAGIKNPLYFGYFENSGSGSSYYNFDLANNLAQRHDEGKGDKAFYASVWGLTGSKLYYPARSIATYGTLVDANNKVHPLFDYTSLQSNSNIASLVKTGLNFPFYESEYRGITTYSYDSTTDYNRKYSDSTKDFYITDDYSLGSDADGTQYTGYFPFGGNSDKVSNTGFGTEFDIDFYMTDSGKLVDDDNKEQDICFNFSGDDDVWVYIDGVLVLDLGGDHKISAGSINFSDMMVYYKSAAKDTDNINAHNVTDTFATSSNYVKAVNMAELFAANGINFDNTDPSTMHTLQMFYMERGTFQSNCSISFNLPQNSGLRINSDVDTSKVNKAFVDDTLISANEDFFSYTIKNKAASDTEYTNIKAAYATAAAKVNSLSVNGLTLGSPEFPILSNVNRDFKGVIYRLSLSTNTEDKKESDDYIGTNGSSQSFIPVRGVNYKLNDAYSKADSDNDALLGVTGRTDSNGTFKLLFDQSAQFDTKITPNSLVQITQNNDVYDTVSETGSIVKSSTEKQRNLYDYYSTKYTITDDRSGTIIKQSPSLIKSKNGGIVADDDASNDASFYFSNYTGDATDSSYAMTVTFINSVDVGTIKIEKSLAKGLTANTDKFFFDVEFSNVFAGSSAKKKYSDLVYKVYNSDNTLVTENTYGSTGIILQAGQYALIEGVPVGTKYTVTERTRVGYAIESVSAQALSTLGTVINSNTVTVKDNIVSGIIPVATDYVPANFEHSSISTSSFVNIRQAITITFKYYDREVESGTVSHINEEATVYNLTLPEIPSDFCTLNNNGEVIAIQLGDLINHAAMNFTQSGVSVDNIIDEYQMWTSQAKAVEAMQNIVNLHTGNNYTESEAVWHTNAYGISQTDSEKWVNYYDESGNSLDAENFAAQDAGYSKIKSITVWLFNQPKKYTLTMNYAKEANEIKSLDNGNYIATGDLSKSYEAYYNMRLGGAHSSASMNSAGEYLEKYGIAEGFIKDSTYTNPVINKNGKDLKFLYWSDKADGSTIVSTDIFYYYRITADRELYAVYGLEMSTDPGLTVSQNQSDIYFDSNGVSKTRLNTQMNTYNCPDNDKNIAQTSIVYLMIHSDMSIDNDLEKIRTDIVEILHNSTSTSVGATVVTINKKANGYIYNVKENASEVTSSSDVTLTNKNRMQFSITFSTSALNTGKVRMCAFAAMNYNGEWIVSDNYVDYNFLQNSKA